jgi:hypothetical protein
MRDRSYPRFAPPLSLIDCSSEFSQPAFVSFELACAFQELAVLARSAVESRRGSFAREQATGPEGFGTVAQLRFAAV